MRKKKIKYCLYFSIVFFFFLIICNLFLFFCNFSKFKQKLNIFLLKVEFVQELSIIYDFFNFCCILKKSIKTFKLKKMKLKKNKN